MSLDQFYTRPEFSEEYVGQVLERWRDPDVLFVEPSAGTGAFAHPLLGAGRKVFAIDMDPRTSDIVRSDFLLFDLSPYKDNHSAIVVVGNPPFGKNACTAVRFFNHAARHADEIAFIVPRTFRKLSLQKRLDKMFHLSHDEDVGNQAFIRFGNSHDVPCAWQIWTKRKISRPVPIPPSVDHLIIYTTPANACFAMRRVGFYTGRIITENFTSLSKSTHYFIRELADGVVDALRTVDWTAIAAQTAGSRSLSKAEIAFKLNEAYYSRSIRQSEDRQSVPPDDKGT
ncbi:MAG: hypothetical protein OXD29_00855 [Roseovarius sp.]|nr:hypothetical protein [Roseovarius sp.]